MNVKYEPSIDNGPTHILSNDNLTIVLYPIGNGSYFPVYQDTNFYSSLICEQGDRRDKFAYLLDSMGYVVDPNISIEFGETDIFDIFDYEDGYEFEYCPVLADVIKRK